MVARRRDAGAILPLVLVVVVFLSVVVVATARYAGANLRFGTVVGDRAVATSAAEAGVRYAAGRARTNSLTTCDGGPIELVPTATEAIAPSADLTVTCQRLDSGLPTLAGWAAVVTGEGIVSPTIHLLIDADGPTASTGRVFVSTPLQDVLRINVDDVDLHGDLFYDGSGDGCATIYEYDELGSIPYDFDDDIVLPSGSFVCWPQRWDDIVAEPPIATLPSGPQPMWTTSGSCRVFEPGRYTSLDLQRGGDNYFRSGVYLFDDVTIATDNGGTGTTTILAGYPHSVTYDNRLITSGGCAAAWAADGLDGGPDGVTWYLDGTSRIVIEDDAIVEMLPMLHSDGVRDHAVSVHVLASASPSGSVIEEGTGSNNQVLFHGQIWAPYETIDLDEARGDADGQVTSGVVAASLVVSSSSGSVGSLGPDITPVDHRLLITSVAAVDGVEIEVRAIVEHRPNDPVGSRVAVNSARIVD